MSEEIMVRIPQRTVIDLMNVIRDLNEENKRLRNENKKGKDAKIKPWCEDCLIPSPCAGNCERERVTAEELKKELTCFGEFEFKAVCLSCKRGVLCKTYTEKNNE